MSGHTENFVFINADIDLVWERTNDVAGWPDLFTEYASVEIMERRDNTVRFRLTMYPDENGTAWSWVSERTVHPEEYRVEARRVEPGPFEYMNIEWSYAAEDGGTRMRWAQDFAMRPDAPIDDTGMTNRINTNTKIQMDIIREKIEKLAHGGDH